MDLKTAVSKLEGGENWVKWKKQVTLFLRHYNVMGVVNGLKTAPPALTSDASEAQRTEYERKLAEYKKDDSFAQLIIFGTLKALAQC
ncbi:hypothetical protein RF55_23392 [Lasius niger]|uniref:Retrovirus-related pol polyprotein from transposon tnt 1-94 n=1 Tax=Lasius niger TaxID=67767 RepID=A0A0J7JW08_LASNI|nr:hypothetical protein RF55_23392 [Lasius niger]